MLKMKNVWRWVIRIFSWLFEFLFKLVAILSGASFLFFTILLACFTISQITTSLALRPNETANALTSTALKAVGLDVTKLKTPDYSTILSTAIGSIAVIVTLWYTLAAFFANLLYRRSLAKKSIVQSHKILTVGSDDLEIMARYFKGADKVIVFSGDFSWLNQAHRLIGIVDSLVQQQKIFFVSYKSQGSVSAAVGANYPTYQPQFRYSSGPPLKCSLIHIGQRKVLLYVADTSADPGGERKVCVISSRNDAQHLLETISQLCEQYV